MSSQVTKILGYQGRKKIGGPLDKREKTYKKVVVGVRNIGYDF
jgi:hypothetical protein